MTEAEYWVAREIELRRSGYNPSQVANKIREEVAMGGVGVRDRREARLRVVEAAKVAAEGEVDGRLGELTEVVRGEGVREMGRVLGLSEDDVWCEMALGGYYTRGAVEGVLSARLPARAAEDVVEEEKPKRRWRRK